MTSNGRPLGIWAEDYAARYLRQYGYQIVDRNFRCPLGEVDIVAEDGDGLAFVEVRARRWSDLLAPEETITRRKLNRILAAADVYLQQRQIDVSWRIDLVAIELDRRHRVVRIELIRGLS